MTEKERLGKRECPHPLWQGEKTECAHPPWSCVGWKWQHGSVYFISGSVAASF